MGKKSTTCSCMWPGTMFFSGLGRFYAPQGRPKSPVGQGRVKGWVYTDLSWAFTCVVHLVRTAWRQVGDGVCARWNWVRGKSIKRRNDLRYMSTYIRALACHLRFSKNISGNFSFPPGGIVACAPIPIVSTCCFVSERNFQFLDCKRDDRNRGFRSERFESCGSSPLNFRLRF